MKIYNSLTNKKETFKTVNPKKLNMYVCGPTVYNYIHIGNARPVVFFDVVKRYFLYKGYEVNYVVNITDVDDKIILESEKLGISEKELTTIFTDAYIRDITNLNALLPNKMPRATSYITEMIFYINKLIEKGYAYHNNDVYFRVSKIDEYGQLSNQVLEDLQVGARIEENSDKENPLDFTLWKQTSVGISFDSPWGKGRPGWHTECACMNKAIFDEVIDIHGGGSDLKFPHHENEIAQSRAISNHPLANYWMHVGRLDMDNVKMSKSLGNIVLVKDLLKEYEYQAFRLLILSHHYRQPIGYSKILMDQFNNEWQRIKRALKQAFVEMSVKYYEKVEYDLDQVSRFEKALEDDFNIANGLTVIYELVKTMNREEDVSLKAKAYYTAILLLDILGINLEQKRLTDEQIKDYHAWVIARNEKRYQDADEIRLRLNEAGIL
ncbi:MAG: cysteine--tRNA ligase [Acholeplasmataceae bacterium]|nr:cysteine--tRNA ligase [Acholeplasmataceae bacterium]